MRVLFHSKLALVSRPRCASTSLRRALDEHIKVGDLRCDVAGENPPFHPHLTASHLKQILREHGQLKPSLLFFTTIRNPTSLLYSYWSYFRPDNSGFRYRFSKGWDSSNHMGFEDWVLHGSARFNPARFAYAPNWVSTRDLSHLSLEARAFNGNTLDVDHVFQVENLRVAEAFLSDMLGARVNVGFVNQSNGGSATFLGNAALEKIRIMFPFESDFYNV
jgi:hypothetical protein